MEIIFIFGLDCRDLLANKSKDYITGRQGHKIIIKCEGASECANKLINSRMNERLMLDND